MYIPIILYTASKTSHLACMISTWQEIENRPDLAISGFRAAGVVSAIETSFQALQIAV